MIYFKACPRCSGDIVVNKDQYGQYLECLQCGYETDAQDASEKVKTLATTREEVTAGAR